RTGGLMPQPAAPLVGADSLGTLSGRSLQALEGPGALTLASFGEGLVQDWAALDQAEPAAWLLPRDYNIDGGTNVPVPSCWNTNRPDWRLFEGVGWYAHSFNWQPRQRDERILLHVGAAACESHV